MSFRQPPVQFGLPLAAIVLWSGNAVVSKASAGILPPGDIAFYRWAVTAILLAPFAGGAIWRQRSAILAELPRLIVLGLLGCALFPSLMYLAAASTSAMRIGLIQALLPILALLLARALIGTRVTRNMLGGAALSLVGVALVVAEPGAQLADWRPPNRGDVLMLVAVGCFALYSVLLGRWQTRLPLVADLFGQASVAVLSLLPIFSLAPSHPMPAAGLWLVGYAALGASIAAPMLWMRGIAMVGPARAAALFSLLPVITAGLAIGFLNEKLTFSLIAGGVLIMAGVVLAQRVRRG